VVLKNKGGDIAMPTIHAALHKTVVTNDNTANTEVTDLGDYPSNATISIDCNEIFGDQRAYVALTAYMSGSVAVTLR
jgi:hypothetical protein